MKLNIRVSTRIFSVTVVLKNNSILNYCIIVEVDGFLLVVKRWLLFQAEAAFVGTMEIFFLRSA